MSGTGDGNTPSEPTGIEVSRIEDGAGGAVYGVKVHFAGGGEDVAVFANERAFGRANEQFEEWKTSPDAYEVWLTRNDTGNPVFVGRQGRRSLTEPWVDIPFAADPLPDPLDPDDGDDEIEM